MRLPRPSCNRAAAVAGIALLFFASGCRSAHNDRLSIGRDLVLPSLTSTPLRDGSETAIERFMVPLDTTVHGVNGRSPGTPRTGHPRETGEMPTIESALDIRTPSAWQNGTRAALGLVAGAAEAATLPIRLFTGSGRDRSSPAALYRRSRQSGWHPIPPAPTPPDAGAPNEAP